jgi:hypothetical protein
VLRVKLVDCGAAAGARRAAAAEAGGWWRIPVEDAAHIEERWRSCARAGATVASVEVAEPELEEVFVKIMRRGGGGAGDLALGRARGRFARH